MDEGVGDTLALSVMTVKHLYKLGLYPTNTLTPEIVINTLFSKALEDIIFLPFSYTMDAWRFDTFDGITTIDSYNHDYWKYR